MEPPTVWLKVECPRASTSQPAFPLAPNTYRRGLRRAWYRTQHEACRASADPSDRSELSRAWRLKQSFSLNGWWVEGRKVPGVDTVSAAVPPLPVRRDRVTAHWCHVIVRGDFAGDRAVSSAPPAPALSLVAGRDARATKFLTYAADHLGCP